MRPEGGETLPDRLSSHTIEGAILDHTKGPERVTAKGKPVAASQPSSPGNRRPPRRHERPTHHDRDKVEERASGPWDEPMDRPVRRSPEPPREDVMCQKALVPRQEAPPLHPRKGLATMRPRVVETRGHLRLLCDGLHDGAHEWPEVFQMISERDGDDLPGDGVDEGKVVVD